MRWQNREGSSNVDDRRKGKTARRVGGGLGLGTVLSVIIALLLGENPLALMEQLGGAAVQEEVGQVASRPDDELAQFVSVVLKDTEDVWNKLFREQLNRSYREPTLVLFDGQVQSACGFGSAASGPFYCPGDQKLYIDLSF